MPMSPTPGQAAAGQVAPNPLLDAYHKTIEPFIRTRLLEKAPVWPVTVIQIGTGALAIIPFDQRNEIWRYNAEVRALVQRIRPHYVGVLGVLPMTVPEMQQCTTGATHVAIAHLEAPGQPPISVTRQLDPAGGGRFLLDQVMPEISLSSGVASDWYRYTPDPDCQVEVSIQHAADELEHRLEQQLLTLPPAVSVILPTLLPSPREVQ